MRKGVRKLEEKSIKIIQTNIKNNNKLNCISYTLAEPNGESRQPSSLVIDEEESLAKLYSEK